MIITNARVLTFDAANRVLDAASVEIRGGTIGAVTKKPAAGGDIVDAGGRVLMPALINCHTHLYGTLARGIALPGPPPRNFKEILKKLWWRLDSALNEDDIYYSALVGLIDSARSGVGTLADHHSSPHAVSGSLDRIEQAFREVGLRGSLCYETTDRNGALNAAEGLRENIRFIGRTRRESSGLIHACFGLHASFTLGGRTLSRAVEANASLGAGFHIHVAEDRADVADARRRCGKSPVVRLAEHGVLDERALAAHCVHVDGGDMALLASRGVNVVHNPQSNCNNAVGTAPLLEMIRRRVLVGLGSDGYSPRLWDEFRTAFQVQKLAAGDPRVAFAEAYAVALRNNRAIARKLWGLDLGRISPGACADLVLVDYYPPTPLTADNLFGHIVFGIANAPVNASMVAGRWVVREGRCVNVDERAVAERAARQARALWKRF